MALTRVLALLAAAALLAACGTRSDRAGNGSGVDAPGILVFDGLGKGSYLNSIHADASELHGVELPRACSPKDFTRDGRVLICYEWNDVGGEYAVEQKGDEWRRVPLPPEERFPAWVFTAMAPAENFVTAPQWSPARDRITLIRTGALYRGGWFSGAGSVVVADAEGGEERVVAEDGEVPVWSPDGTRLAFARCRVTKAEPTNEDAADSAECSLWVVSADETETPEKLVDKTDSAPVWSPDGGFVAFLRATGSCTVVCKRRIVVVPARGGDPRPIGPELIEPSQLFWLPDSAPVANVRGGISADDPLELQRCVDIWNRARMQWGAGAASVSIGKDGCRVNVTGGNLTAYENEGSVDTGFQCWQLAFTFRCPSHGGQLRMMNPAERVWNAWVDRSGRLSLFDMPKEPRLPLPKAPPHPIVDGYIVPFDSDGNLRQGLTISETHTGDCVGKGWFDHPDSLDCGWEDGEFSYIDHYCFKAPGPLRVGDVVLCSEYNGATSFIQLKLSKVDEPRD